MAQLTDLPSGTILLVEVGSGAHGTGLPGQEDHDELAVVVESPREVFGPGPDLKTVMQRTQPEGSPSGPGDVDRTLYSLRKFLRLAANGNPSIMLAFWAPVIQATPLGQELRELAPHFIGRHMIPRYRGYMRGQVERILGVRGGAHGKRGGGRREELVAEHGYDTKYAMHAARLGFQCLELCHKRQLQLPIRPFTGGWLRAVRRGEVPFDDWWGMVLRLDRQMASFLEDGPLPEGPNLPEIQEWAERAHLELWMERAFDAALAKS